MSAQTAGDPDYGGWLSETSNYDGTVDETGTSRVTIAVGAAGNNGNFAFDPAAVRVDPGTTIVWEWTGEGSVHDVVEETGAFESELTDEAGHTFEYTVEQEGIFKYSCSPHASMGMKGALAVGGTQAGEAPNGGGGEASDGGAGDILAIGGGLGLAGVLLAAVLSGSRGETQGDRSSTR